MTATPITTNPMEMVQLINLCKPTREQMPVDFDDFSNKYLDVDSGKFSELGLKQYLDDIAGYVSYLNREKDARQFAQPIIHQVRVPLVNTNDIKMFDKRATRELVNTDILKLKDTIEINNEKLLYELNDLDINKFKVLRKECDSFSSKAICNRIAQQNMRKIVKEAQEEVRRIKADITRTRESIRMHKIFKQENLIKIANKIEANPEDYEKFKQGTYYNMKTKCGKTIRTETELLREHPDLEAFVRADTAQTYKIKEMERMLKISETSFKSKIQELKQMLKTNLSDLERSVVKLVIKDTQRRALTAKRYNQKTFIEQVNRVNKTRKSIEKQRKKRIGSLKRELKEQLKDEKMERTELLRAEKSLRKHLRKQDDYTEEIKNGILVNLIDKYKDIMKEQLVEERNKENEKLEKKHQKEEAKKTKQLQKEQEKITKLQQKEEANKTKKLQREQDKLIKLQQKEEANKTKKLQKEQDKLIKLQQKKEARKTKKNKNII